MSKELKRYFAEALYDTPKQYEPETSWQVYKAYDVGSVLASQRATIQQLEARVKELNEWKSIVIGSGTDQETVVRMLATDYTRVAIQSWKQVNEKLQARISELEEKLAELQGEP